ncbi:MAG: T9SS C-terminal target domain-containing protein [Bacteroidetes bacterium]|nr:MAG: T9SS C-terminal target domain-containing protein [Bacteroidota bacterium]
MYLGKIYNFAENISMKNLSRILLLFCLQAMVFLPVSFSQGQNDKVNRVSLHKEVPDDSYLPPSGNQMKSLKGYNYITSSVFTTQVNVDEYGNNIPDDAANEPSIAIDPTNPDVMVIGWRQFDNIGSNFRQAGYGYTTDGGQSWTFPGVIDPGVFRSDPVLDANADGKVFYNSLTSDGYSYTCKVFRSDDGGAQWDDGVNARGGDKQWMVIDRTEGIGAGNIYSFWTAYYSSCYPGFFTRSTNGGDFYQNCVGVAGSPYWGTMAVGPDGELYIVGVGEDEGVVVAKSTTAQNPPSVVSWDLAEQVFLDGHLTGWSPINPEGIMGQADIGVDGSDGPGRGNVYVLASVERPLAGDPADVMFSKSTDGGLNWSLFPVRINDDPENDHYQWFGTMSVAPDGRIDVVWLDTRDAPTGSYLSALYYSYSTDEGETWSTNERLSELFDPHVGWPQQQKMGDYFDMRSDETGAHLAWANTLNGEQDVYYSHITPTYIAIDEASPGADALELTCYPNPFTGRTTIRYVVPVEGYVQLDLINLYGQVVATLAEGVQQPGLHTVNYQAEGLSAGYYYGRLKVDNQQSVIGIVKVR